MTEDDAEALAWSACSESGLDDRPNCDPLVFAVGALDLILVPMARVEAHIVGRRLYYRSDDTAEGIAYCVSHECGHVLALDAWPHLDAETEELVASRIGVGLLLPRPRYRRDLHAHGWSLDVLRELWPLASPWIHARRIAEVTSDGAVASRWTRRGCVSRVVTPGVVAPETATVVERTLARAALNGEAVDAGPRLRAWPVEGGAIVLCGVEEMRTQLARVTPPRSRRQSGEG
jgi:hypothetical protein